MDLPKIIAVDFDGTCVTHEYPDVGQEIGAAKVLRKFANARCKLILWTIRSGPKLHDALQWFDKHGLPVYGINRNPAQFTWSESPKAYAELYIDDAAFGAPLIHDINHKRPYFDWKAVDQLYFP